MSQKILVIDDSPEVVDLIKAILEEKGFAIITASNGREGLEKIRADRPALIVADVLMPQMDGFQFFKEIRKDKETRDIPVVILTARIKMEDTFKALGVDSFISKPLDAQDLISIVEKEVGRYLGIGTKRSSPPAVVPRNGDSAGLATDVDYEQFSATEGKKVLIFGTHEKVLREMAGLLEEQQHNVVVVTDERQLFSKIDWLEPQLIILQLVTEAKQPIDEIVLSISSIIKNKQKKIDADMDNTKIILFKVEEEALGIGSVGADIADTESLVERCYESGCAKYIGSYAAISFLTKIRSFLA